MAAAAAGLSSQLFRYGAAISVGALLGGGIAQNFTTAPDSTAKVAKKLDPEILKHGHPKSFSPGIQCYSNHCLEYDPQRRTPLWVAEHINVNKLQPKDKDKVADRKHSKFRQDESLPIEIRVWENEID